MLTLRQIEIIRAVMVSGTIAGAARLLGVSAPGISRAMKYIEQSLKIEMFVRKQNRYYPTPEAEDIFEQINGVYKKVDDLRYAVDRLELGHGMRLKIASVPSLSNIMVPRAIRRLKAQYPDLDLDLDVIKVQEAQDYLLLGKTDLAVLSYGFDHPGIEVSSLACGSLRCMVPEGHELAARGRVAAADIARHPLVGVPPADPYGDIMTEVFRRLAIPFDMSMSVRFGVTTIGLVRAGLGVAIIDEFAVAHGVPPGVCILEIEEPTRFEAFYAVRRDRPLSRAAEAFLRLLRDELSTGAQS